MLHYYHRHVSSINMPIFRRKNCIHTASGIVALCKRLHSTPVESRAGYAFVRRRCSGIYLQGFRKTSTYIYEDSSGITVRVLLIRGVKERSEKIVACYQTFKYYLKIYCSALNYIFIYLLRQPPPQWARASSFTRFLDHTQRRTTVCRTPLDE